ncbi:MAG: hypothetical protein ETSY1_46785 (plasmid) [Candidatus Entotheonella factor]|uniref:IraD/Gp25-like domain-containing protein n=1 Tax=Entotheonella factor TaxID=1429438 RepID=W4M0R8_ENTF1|nr:MAG: hypothetical protein ETSY1_46785 [Candidatus Entotheonella factor]
MDAQTGRALDDLDHLRQSIRDILTTRIGTRVQRRSYGSRLPELVDTPMHPDRTIEWYAATAEALGQWEPRFRLTRVRIAEATERGVLTLDLEGEYLPDGRTLTLEGIIIG